MLIETIFDPCLGQIVVIFGYINKGLWSQIVEHLPASSNVEDTSQILSTQWQTSDNVGEL